MLCTPNNVQLHYFSTLYGTFRNRYFVRFDFGTGTYSVSGAVCGRKGAVNEKAFFDSRAVIPAEMLLELLQSSIENQFDSSVF